MPLTQSYNKGPLLRSNQINSRINLYRIAFFILSDLDWKYNNVKTYEFRSK
jgi:hypothetical protein